MNLENQLFQNSIGISSNNYIVQKVMLVNSGTMWPLLSRSKFILQTLTKDSLQHYQD